MNVTRRPSISASSNHREPVPALDREDHRRADHDADHHQRRDRSLGRLGDGACRLRPRLAVPAWACRCRSRSSLALLAGRRRRALQRLLDRLYRPAVAGRHARRPDRLSRHRPHPRRGSRHRRLSAWFNTLGQQPLLGPLTASIVIFAILFVVIAIVLHGSALRPPRLRHRQQRRGGALFRRARASW